jgi:hypothetical protein
MRVRRAIPVVLLALLGASGSVSAQDASPGAGDDPSLCVLSVDEVAESTGLPLVAMAEGPANCTYDADPAVMLATLDVRLEAPEPMLEGGDLLAWVRTDYPDAGRDLTVAGFPAWEAAQGLWVDLGDQVFVVQPILFFLDEPPDARSFLVPVGELALSRLGIGGG